MAYTVGVIGESVQHLTQMCGILQANQTRYNVVTITLDAQTDTIPHTEISECDVLLFIAADPKKHQIFEALKKSATRLPAVVPVILVIDLDTNKNTDIVTFLAGYTGWYLNNAYRVLGTMLADYGAAFTTQTELEERADKIAEVCKQIINHPKADKSAAIAHIITMCENIAFGENYSGKCKSTNDTQVGYQFIDGCFYKLVDAKSGDTVPVVPQTFRAEWYIQTRLSLLHKNFYTAYKCNLMWMDIMLLNSKVTWATLDWLTDTNYPGYTNAYAVVGDANNYLISYISRCYVKLLAAKLFDAAQILYYKPTKAYLSQTGYYISYSPAVAVASKVVMPVTNVPLFRAMFKNNTRVNADGGLVSFWHNQHRSICQGYTSDMLQVIVSKLSWPNYTAHMLKNLHLAHCPETIAADWTTNTQVSVIQLPKEYTTTLFPDVSDEEPASGTALFD